MNNPELEAYQRYQSEREARRIQWQERQTDESRAYRDERIAEHQATAADWKENYTTILNVLRGETDEIEWDGETWDIREAYLRQVNYANALRQVIEQLVALVVFGEGEYAANERIETVGLHDDDVHSFLFDVVLDIARTIEHAIHMTQGDRMIEEELEFRELMDGLDVDVLDDDTAKELAIIAVFPAIEKARKALDEPSP